MRNGNRSAGPPAVAPAGAATARGPGGAVLGVILLAGAALLAGCAAAPQAGQDAASGTPAAAAAAPGTPLPSEAIAALLPDAAASFARGATVPVLRPMEGLEVNYATPGRRAAAFVQIVRPGSGTANDTAAAEYTRWRTETSTGARPGRRLSIVQEFQEAAGPGFRCAALEGSYGRQPVQSMVCVGARAGHVLRVRVSMMRDTPPAADARAFLRDVAVALNGA